ncbi:MAG TPA: GNAT family N-acetyltransferase, partial [Chthonomonadales bacterium]|nr:GNAT family N-acetyltransferase [Chthonomonadales bacterium]
RLLQVRGEGRLIGLAPLYSSWHLGTPLRRLAFVGTGASDYLDILAEEGCEIEVGVAILRYLTQSAGFDLADLQQLRPQAGLRAAAECFGQQYSGPWKWRIVSQELCPFVPLPSTWEEYGARLGKKMRANLSYYDRLLSRSFEKAEVQLAGAEELSQAMSAFIDLHQRRWRARLLPGVLRSGRVQEFHCRVAKQFQRRGWLRLHVTKINGRVAAALYCFRFRERYYYYLGGFDPELAKYSLGTVLTAHAIRRAIEEGCAEFDFLRGNEPYKHRWMPEERLNCRLLLVRPGSLRSQAMLRLNRFERYIEHRIKAYAEKRGRKSSR